ncbi:hypothetical protein [Actinomycetospora flava]|uniref:Uncharacterized protein n=1 Tax=Actinomycetospora flava TaxID=3129232 RepID=A0ABU8MCN3_9PSEU
MGRGYWLVVAGEAAALVAGLWLINGVLAALLGTATGSVLVVQLLAGVGSGAALLGSGAAALTTRTG